MIIDKLTEHLTDEERKELPAIRESIFRDYAIYFQGTSASADTLPLFMLNRLAESTIEANCNDQKDFPLSMGTVYANRMTSIYWHAADRYAAREDIDFCEDALEIGNALDRNDFAVWCAYRGILSHQKGKPFAPANMTEEEASGFIANAATPQIRSISIQNNSLDRFFNQIPKMVRRLVIKYAKHKALDTVRVSTDLATKSIFSGQSKYMFINRKNAVRIFCYNEKLEPVETTLSTFDYLIFQIVNSEINQGNMVLSASIIYRYFQPNAKAVPDEMERAINDSLLKMALTWGDFIDPNLEGDARKLWRETILKFSIEMRLINGGQIVPNAYVFESMSRWYAHAFEDESRRPMLQSLRLAAMEMNGRVTPQRVKIQGFMIQRLCDMASGRISHVIDYESIFTALLPENATAKERHNVHESVLSILNGWGARGILKNQGTQNNPKYFTEKKGAHGKLVSVSFTPDIGSPRIKRAPKNDAEKGKG